MSDMVPWSSSKQVRRLEHIACKTSVPLEMLTTRRPLDDVMLDMSASKMGTPLSKS